MAASKNEDGGSRGLLPLFFVCFFSLAAFHALFFELGPAMRDHRMALRNLDQQMNSHQSLVSAVKAKRKRRDSLLNDPQSIENELDQKGSLPPKVESR